MNKSILVSILFAFFLLSFVAGQNAPGPTPRILASSTISQGSSFGYDFIFDVDGDSIKDLVVFPQNVSSPPDVISGATGQVLFSLAKQTNFAPQVVTIYDSDADGSPEIAVSYPSAPAQNIQGYLVSGLIEVYSGVNGQYLFNIVPSPSSFVGVPFLIPLTTTSQITFAQHIYGFGDSNADSIPDSLAVASDLGAAPPPVAPLPFVLAGLPVFVYHLNGATGFYSTPFYSISQPLPNLGIFGTSLMKDLGDLDNDGFTDILIQETPMAFSPILTDRFFVYSGSNGALLFQLTPYLTQSLYELDASPLDDLNGDGFNDFALSFDDASFYLSSSTISASVNIYSGSSGALLYSFSDPNPSPPNGNYFVGRFGRFIAQITDISGDSLADLAVSDHIFNPYLLPSGQCVPSLIPSSLKLFSLSSSGSTLLSSLDDPLWPACSPNSPNIPMGYKLNSYDADGDGVLELAYLSEPLLYSIVYKLFGATSYGQTISTGTTPSAQVLSLSYTQNSLVNGAIDITISGAVPNSLGVLLLSRGSSNGITFNNGVNALWVDPTQLVPYFDPYVFNYDANGQFSWTTNINDPSVQSLLGSGANVYLQAFNLPTNNPAFVASSNGIQVSYI
ncbi:MAG: hypothetical protein ACP5NS_01705 [Candidatus Pacearchaeota archaeon]